MILMEYWIKIFGHNNFGQIWLIEHINNIKKEFKIEDIYQ